MITAFTKVGRLSLFGHKRAIVFVLIAEVSDEQIVSDKIPIVDRRRTMTTELLRTFDRYRARSIDSVIVVFLESEVPNCLQLIFLTCEDVEWSHERD